MKKRTTNYGGGHKTARSAKGARRSGTNYEREVAALLCSVLGEGRARRVPLSGSMTSWPDDVEVLLPVLGKRRVECKIRNSRGDRTKVIRDWLGDADFLVTRLKAGSGRKPEHFVFMRWAIFGELLGALVEAQKADVVQLGLALREDGSLEEPSEELQKLLAGEVE